MKQHTYTTTSINASTSIFAAFRGAAVRTTTVSNVPSSKWNHMKGRAAWSPTA